MARNYDRRNKYAFGLGTVGRDMFYTTVSMYLMHYLTEVMGLSGGALATMTAILAVLRGFDAFNDPVMGILVDNTKSRWGKFKPGMLIGAAVGALLMVLMFSDLGLSGAPYYTVFIICYLGWDLFYGLNDISYWSMLPTLSTDQKEREKIGSFARICANVGMFAVVVGILPLTGVLADAAGSAARGWFLFAVIAAVLMLAFQSVTLFGVRERAGYFKEERSTTVRGMLRAIFKNDQLLWVAVSMSLFMIGYTTTTSFGTYFFIYAYGEEAMYSAFAAVLGVSQLTALSVFPLFSKKWNRRQLYTGATVLVVLGYILFFFAPMNMLPIGIAGVLIFVGQAFIQLLMLMFLADTIEYGQWKFRQRNDSVTFSVQPFINKISGAAATGIVGFTLIRSGIDTAASTADVTPGGITVMKFSMLLLPLAAIVAGYLIYLWKFKIDEKKYAEILEDLRHRGDIDRIGEEAGTD